METRNRPYLDHRFDRRQRKRARELVSGLDQAEKTALAWTLREWHLRGEVFETRTGIEVRNLEILGLGARPDLAEGLASLIEMGWVTTVTISREIDGFRPSINASYVLRAASVSACDLDPAVPLRHGSQVQAGIPGDKG